MSKEKANERINRQSSPQGNRKQLTALIIIAVCAIIGIIAFVVSGKDDVASYNRVVTPDNVDDVISAMDAAEFTPAGSYTTTMNSDWTFPDGESASTNAYVENDVRNQNTVYFTIVMKEDSSQVLYTSPEIPVGSHLANIKLDTPLDAGVYDTVIIYHLVDDNHQELSKVSLALTLTIEK